MMKKIILMILGLTLCLFSNEGDSKRSMYVHSDLGLGFYNLDIQGSTYVRAIAYNVAELSFGISETYGSWEYGLYYKGVIDEISTNSDIPRTGGKDSANIR